MLQFLQQHHRLMPFFLALPYMKISSKLSHTRPYRRLSSNATLRQSRPLMPVLVSFCTRVSREVATKSSCRLRSLNYQSRNKTQLCYCRLSTVVESLGIEPSNTAEMVHCLQESNRLTAPLRHVRKSIRNRVVTRVRGSTWQCYQDSQLLPTVPL